MHLRVLHSVRPPADADATSHSAWTGQDSYEARDENEGDEIKLWGSTCAVPQLILLYYSTSCTALYLYYIMLDNSVGHGLICPVIESCGACKTWRN